MKKNNRFRAFLTPTARPPFIFTGGIALLLLVLWVPKWQTSSYGLNNAKEQAEVENASRQTLLQGIGGLFFFVTAYLSWRNLQTTEKNYRISEDKQITERFSKAVEMLSSEKIEVRLGGIYVLERIARDSPEDHWTVMEVLTAFIRELSKRVESNSDNSADRSQQPPKVDTDIQAALTVIGKRDVGNDPRQKSLNLSNASLSGVNLIGTNLSGANLIGTNLSGASLIGANLNGSKLIDAIFSRTNLSKANLCGADLWVCKLIGANLRGADLRNAKLRGANLHSAELIDADLRGADLRGADLCNAFLWKTDLSNADLDGANLSGANFSGANLSGAKNWTNEQLGGAKLCSTKLPEGSKLDSNQDCKTLEITPEEIENS